MSTSDKITALKDARSIPRAPSLPIIGRALSDRRANVGTLARIRDHHGDLVWIHIFGRLEVLAFLSADGLESGLRNKDGAYSNRLGWERFLDHVFPGAILAMDGDQHRYHRRILQEAFTRANLDGYVEQMNPVIARRVETLRTQTSASVYPFVKSLALDIATRVFMGAEPGADADRVNRAFVEAVQASIALVRLPVWPLPYYKGIRGQAFLAERFRQLLADKRATASADLFSKLCHVRSEDGEAFTDAEVVNHMVFVMMAAHDTSTSTLSTAIYYLAKHPEWQERLRKQSLALPDELSLDELEQLEEHSWVMDESLRLHPPLPFMPRVTVTETEFAGYRIPAGILAGFAPLVVHRDPRHWTRPNTFDPERFSSDRAEHKTHPYAFAPFGGGRHLCVGKRFGQLEIRSTIHQMLKKIRWSVPEGYEMPFQFMPIGKPRDGLPVRLTAI
jgi:cytochrome P450